MTPLGKIVTEGAAMDVNQEWSQRGYTKTTVHLDDDLRFKLPVLVMTTGI